MESEEPGFGARLSGAFYFVPLTELPQLPMNLFSFLYSEDDYTSAGIKEMKWSDLWKTWGMAGHTVNSVSM